MQQCRLSWVPFPYCIVSTDHCCLIHIFLPKENMIITTKHCSTSRFQILDIDNECNAVSSFWYKIYNIKYFYFLKRKGCIALHLLTHVAALKLSISGVRPEGTRSFLRKSKHTALQSRKKRDCWRTWMQDRFLIHRTAPVWQIGTSVCC